MKDFFDFVRSAGLLVLCLFSSLLLFSQPLTVDFGATGSVVAGTPLGNGPGWIHYAANGTRWDAYASNNGYQIVRNGTSNQLFFANDGRLGIRKIFPGKMIDVDAGTPANNEGLRVLYASGYGAALLANNTTLGGWFVTNGGSNYAPVWAHSFNILTSPASARNSQRIDQSQYQKYVTCLEQLETTEYANNNEQRSLLPHIGIVSRSAPAELLSYAPKDPNQLDHSAESINLADWTGINTVVIKHLLEENKQMLEEITKIKAELAALREQF